MPKIHILPDQLANQIAAGEVIERPASVVKELLENSLDAGATRIEIDIEGNGTRMIRIIDNGEGMDEDDLLLCLERHGTSKIQQQEDLGAIATLGFRGEAIPSIGSVSQFSISSRPPNTELGTTVVLHYGKLLKVHEAGCSVGTVVEVRNLFGNTPARRKFLRTARTELGHIEDVVKNYALAAEKIGFQLRFDNKLILHLDPDQKERERLAAIIRYNGDFIELSGTCFQAEAPRLSGYLVPPDTSMIGQPRLRVFVNGRTVKDRMIMHGVAEGMHSFLMKGKSPSGLIHIHLDPAEVDVNVHPAKYEVRFRQAREIHTLVTQTVAEAMRGYQEKVRNRVFSPSLQREPTRIPLPDLEENRFPQISVEQSVPAPQPKTAGSTTVPVRPSPKPFPVKRLQPTIEPVVHTVAEPAKATPAFPGSAGTEPGNRPKSYHNLQIIGQYDNLYIFCRNEEGLLVIDQHAAHERLLYERFHRHYFSNSIAKQQLMFPETIELTIQQGQLVEKHQETIEKLGFSLRDFGGNTFVVTAVPAIAAKASPRELFLDLLSQLGGERSSGDHTRIIETIIADMACKAAVKAGTELGLREIDSLLNEMARADLFSHCPHGRPVVKFFPKEDIKKWFYRG